MIDMSKNVVILYDKSLYANDAAVVERIIRRSKYNITHVDIREPHRPTDIQIHLRVPVYSAVSWAHKNILVVNPEQWNTAYSAYMHEFEVYQMMDSWCSWMGPMEVLDEPKREFVCFVTNAATFDYVKMVVPYWTKEYPRLTIYTDSLEYSKLLETGAVLVTYQELTQKVVERISKLYMGHLVCSSKNGLDYNVLNAEACGAFIIANGLPYYKNVVPDAAWISNMYDDLTASVTPLLRVELELAFAEFASYAVKESRLFRNVCQRFEPLLLMGTSNKVLGTPVLQIRDCPHITIITPTYNRAHMIDIAFHNMLATDYPHDKIEWIIVEDFSPADKKSKPAVEDFSPASPASSADKKEQIATDKIIAFQVNTPSINIKYIPIEGRLSIGEKRNYGIKHATHDIILFMDDDDHYPTTSFRRRVAWLQNANIVCCTTLPLYDLKSGTSAVSIPPFHLPLSQRISEATLTFKKSAWVERQFADVSIAEGEGWIQGRESQVIEIPPQQIIVAFTHGSNQSSRVVPEGKVSCFWGFPHEYLHFIHGLAGVKVESPESA